MTNKTENLVVKRLGSPKVRPFMFIGCHLNPSLASTLDEFRVWGLT